MLDLLAGKLEGRPGLTELTEVSLPRRSFVTWVGFRSLLEGLPKLEAVRRHPGKMGRVFEEGSVETTLGSGQLKLRHFCQVYLGENDAFVRTHAWAAHVGKGGMHQDLPPQDPQKSLTPRFLLESGIKMQ